MGLTKRFRQSARRVPGQVLLREAFAFRLHLNIRRPSLSISNSESSMHLRFVILLVVVALSAPSIFAQGTNQPTVDELVAKNIEAKGGATALNSLQTLRSTGKLLVQQGQIELGYLQTKK